MIISKQLIKEAKEELLSYSNMRMVLLEQIKNNSGMNKIYLKQILQVLDLTAISLVEIDLDMETEVSITLYEIFS